jgi:hypothetical protein
VAVEAIDSVVAYVMSMIELHRLIDRLVLTRYVRRVRPQNGRRNRHRDRERRADERDPEDRVAPWWEEPLPHETLAACKECSSSSRDPAHTQLGACVSREDKGARTKCMGATIVEACGAHAAPRE